MEEKLKLRIGRYGLMSKTIILIIDDELEMHWALEKALQQEGYEILKAASGTEGLQILASQEVSIVLLDYKMPGMTGWRLWNRLESSGRTCR
nr:response regulator [Desulforamulus profundi]